MRILVTGGAGFIGSAVVRYIINETDHSVINVDKLTYAGNLESLDNAANSRRYSFERVDICDQKEIRDIFSRYYPDKIMHLAAESHVDRSIESPCDFMQTNIMGTFVLLEEALRFYRLLDTKQKINFRFHHISTDEVYGDLPHPDEQENSDNLPKFTELTPYSPSSPYSASKASADHLVRSWSKTHGLPTLITNCSNNYGYYHYPEKLIPLVILNAINGKPLPIYGRGDQIRDWLFVEDHARALFTVLTKASIGETYNIGGNSEKSNIEVVQTICRLLDKLIPDNLISYNIKSHTDLISYVDDRPGHDRRYAIDAKKIWHELGWRPEETFESGIEKTVKWYLNNLAWCKAVQN